MTTLVTGAGGFIAQHLAAAARRAGATRLVGVDVREGRADHPFDEFVRTDLGDADAVRALVERVRPTQAYHLVGLVRGTDEEIVATNLHTTRVLLAALRRSAPASRVVVIGSAAEYGAAPASVQPVPEDYVGTPTGLYGRVKQQVSALAKEAAAAGQQVMVARPFNVIGPGMSDALVAGAIIHRLQAALQGPPPYAITIGRTSSVRDFVAAEDVAAGLVLVGERGIPGEAYNLCSGEGHSVAEVLDCLIGIARVSVDVQRDEGLLRTGDVDVVVGSRAKAEALGWTPRVKFEESLRTAWEAARPRG